MVLWYVVTERTSCPACRGHGKIILWEEPVKLPNGGISQPSKPSDQWPVCETCGGTGYQERQVDLREAILDIMREAIAADNR